jgi:hypothetical protein
MKSIISIKSISFLLIIVAFVYFVGQFTKVYDPIKDYQFHVSIGKLKASLVETCKNRDGFEIEFTDVLNGGRHYGEIRIKTPKMYFIYDFVLYKKNNGSIISLTSAYDITNKSGGHKKNNVGVKKSMKKFEDEFINAYTLVEYLK